MINFAILKCQNTVTDHDSLVKNLKTHQINFYEIYFRVLGTGLKYIRSELGGLRTLKYFHVYISHVCIL